MLPVGCAELGERAGPRLREIAPTRVQTVQMESGGGIHATCRLICKLNVFFHISFTVHHLDENTDVNFFERFSS